MLEERPRAGRRKGDDIDRIVEAGLNRVEADPKAADLAARE
jgi:hypothetical protein